MSVPIGYESIKALAKELGCKIEDLLVLSRDNNPFFAGTLAHTCAAEWFATWWQKLGFADKSSGHIRSVHYKLVSQPVPPEMPTGKSYLNTKECSGYLGTALKMARYLDMVDSEHLEDRRNPDPVIKALLPDESEPALEVDWDTWKLPEIKIELDDFELPLPDFCVTGYRFSQAHQPYLLEIWIEKSTMDEALLPLCEKYGVNLVVSPGFQSVSSSIALLRRAAAHNKPVRIFYASDFDPAGSFMPDAVARQIEYWGYRLGIRADIKLQPLTLTCGQVTKYQLPSIPIKTSDRRAAGFEERYGMLATELDALEALYSGELARLVEEAIKPYRDPDLEAAWEDAETEADEIAEEAQEWVVADYQEEIDAIQTEVQALLEQYRDRVAALNKELQQELIPYQQRMEFARHAMQTAIDTLEEVFTLPPTPEPDLNDPDDSDWLFDSGRSYMEQLSRYKARRRSDENTAELATEGDCQWVSASKAKPSR